jgi:oligopeptide transport system substrate-binding protein
MSTKHTTFHAGSGGPLSCLFVCLVGFFLVSCARRETDADRGIRDQVLHRGLSADLSGLDPHLITGLPEINVVSALFEGLVGEHPETGAPVPAVAERWTTSADALTWTFHLRANAKWSNGDPVTAHDFVNSIKRVLSKPLGADNAAMLFVLANADSWRHGGVTDFNQVGARAVNDHTLVLTLAHPAPFLLTLLSHPVWYPMHQATLEKHGGVLQRDTRWTDPANFVGNGPFVLKANRRGEVIIADKSPTYWDAATVRLNSIHFKPAADVDGEERAFRAGQLHITEALPVAKVESYRRNQPNVLRITPFLDTYFYRLNTTRPPLDDVRIRRALSLAIDREAITQKITRGGQQPAGSFTPLGIEGYNPPTVLAHNLDEAGRLLAEAGFPEGRGLPPLEIMINSSGNHRIIAEAVQQMWRALGVQVEVNNMEMSSLFAKRRAMDYAVLRSEWVADFADPKSFLDVFRGGSSNNHTGWTSLTYDSLLHAADRTPDPKARHELLRQAETLLLEELPIVPIYHFTTVRLVHPAVRGWHPLPLDRHPYKHVWLEN